MKQSKIEGNTRTTSQQQTEKKELDCEFGRNENIGHWRLLLLLLRCCARICAVVVLGAAGPLIYSFQYISFDLWHCVAASAFTLLRPINFFFRLSWIALVAPFRHSAGTQLDFMPLPYNMNI